MSFEGQLIKYMGSGDAARAYMAARYLAKRADDHFTALMDACRRNDDLEQEIEHIVARLVGLCIDREMERSRAIRTALMVFAIFAIEAICLWGFVLAGLK